MILVSTIYTHPLTSPPKLRNPAVPPRCPKFHPFFLIHELQTSYSALSLTVCLDLPNRFPGPHITDADRDTGALVLARSYKPESFVDSDVKLAIIYVCMRKAEDRLRPFRESDVVHFSAVLGVETGGVVGIEVIFVVVMLVIESDSVIVMWVGVFG
jgi:hypothetical protein